MLKLNSQYAKSYLRDEPTNPNYQQAQKPTYRGQNRNFSRYDQNASIDPRSGYEGGFQHSSYGRKDSSTAKPKLYNDNQLNTFCNREQNVKSSYRQPLEGNLNSLNKSPRLTRQPIPSVHQSYGGFDNKDTNQDFRGRNTYQRYDKMPSQFGAEAFGEKKDFVAKHNKRNEEVKSRITREESYSNHNYHQSQRNFNRYQDHQIKGQNLRHFDNEDAYETKPQRYAKRLIFDEHQAPQQHFASKQDNPKYGQKFLREEQVYKEVDNGLATCRYPGRTTELNQRKNSSYKEVQQTPNRFNKSSSFEPGSAQKKQSLIEKSQMLQQKLKKLTSVQPSSRQAEKTSQFEPQQIISTKVPETYRTSNYIASRNVQTNKYQNPKQPEQTLKQTFTAKNVETYRASAKNFDILRTPSPMAEDRTLNQGQAIQRIMELNGKINQRIQSIISNYAKK